MRTISTFVLLVMIALAPSAARGQVVGVLGGLHASENLFLEAGLAMPAHIPAPFMEHGGLIVGMSVSTEIAPFSAPLIIGGIGTLWLDLYPFPLSLAANIAYYTSDGQHALRLKPEIGFGVLGTRIGYAHAFPLWGDEMRGLNDNEFVVRVMIPLTPIYIPRPDD